MWIVGLYANFVLCFDLPSVLSVRLIADLISLLIVCEIKNIWRLRKIGKINTPRNFDCSNKKNVYDG